MKIPHALRDNRIATPYPPLYFCSNVVTAALAFGAAQISFTPFLHASRS